LIFAKVSFNENIPSIFKNISLKKIKNLAEMVQEKEKRRHEIRPKFNPSNDKWPNQETQY
jgi:hypothetical protein